MKRMYCFIAAVAVCSFFSSRLQAQSTRKHRVKPVVFINQKQVAEAQHKMNIWTIPFYNTTTISSPDSITMLEFDKEKLDTQMVNNHTIKINIHKGASLLQMPGARDYTSFTIFSKNYTVNYSFWFDKNEANAFNQAPLLLTIDTTSSATKRLNL